MHFFLYFLDTKVNLDSLQPLPAKRPHNPRNTSKPPSLVYTSPESLEFIKARDKDANEDFDSISPLSRRKGGRQKKAVRLPRLHLGPKDRLQKNKLL